MYELFKKNMVNVETMVTSKRIWLIRGTRNDLYIIHILLEFKST